MLLDVLAAAQKARRVDRVFVLTDDRHLARDLPEGSAEVLLESRLFERVDIKEPAVAPGGTEASEANLNRALLAFNHWLSRNGARSVMILPGDLPLVTARNIDRCHQQLDEAGAGPAVVLTPDAAGSGTNALILQPPSVIEPAYGTDSAQKHRKRAKERGVHLSVWEDPHLAWDVDTAPQLNRLLEQGERGQVSAGRHTATALELLGDRQDQASHSGSLLRSAIAQAAGGTQS